MLVDAINNRKPPGATESTVLGPFHMVGSPPRPLGADISLDANGSACVVTGRVTDVDGQALPGALIDVWQANGDGFYDVQQPDLQPGTCSALPSGTPTGRRTSTSSPAAPAINRSRPICSSRAAPTWTPTRCSE
jgi:protocatechuate 3,4-dioxygenase beta subunit